MNSTQTLIRPQPAADPPAVHKSRRRGLVDEIVEGLSTDVREGQLQAGDKLPTETALMARFGVSRTVVRESLSRMQASGLVETRHGIGTFVRPPQEGGNFRIDAADFATVADVISALELRISLESEAAGLAAQRRTPENLAAMAAALQAFMDGVASGADTVPSDFQFHMEVARATGNRHFAELMTYLGTMIIPRTRVNTQPVEPQERQQYLQRVHGDHETIYNAIRNQDIEGARAAMRTHLSSSRERLRRSGLGLSPVAGSTSTAA